MGITLDLLERLRANGLFETGSKVLDIGSSNLYSATPDQVMNFIEHYRTIQPDSNGLAFAERLAKGSGYDPQTGGANNAFAGELLEYCGINYLAFDIADGYGTEIFDLNRQQLPDSYRDSFDVVLNIGTTEHVLNQYNSFETIHDAAKVGGHMIHQLPTAGFTDHGYFVYTGRMFFDLAGYNGYEIVDIWYDGPAGDDDLRTSLRSYKSYFPKLAELANLEPIAIPNYALTVIYRKTKNAAFKACLETSTSVGSIPSAVHQSYQTEAGSRTMRDQQIAQGAARWWRWPGWRWRSSDRSADGASRSGQADRPEIAALMTKADDLRGRLTQDPAQLDEIHCLHAKYVAAAIPFPADLEEHSLRLVPRSVRADDTEAATRLVEVLQVQNKPVPNELLLDQTIPQKQEVDGGTGLGNLDAVVAQIESGAAKRDAVMSVLTELASRKQPPPLLLEMKVLEYFLADDPSRIDLKRRLHAVLRLLGKPIPAGLTEEVRADLLEEEYAVDYQKMLDDFSTRVGYSDMEPEFKPLLNKVHSYTMTTVERLYSLWTSVRYLVDAKIEGDLVEAGVWRGGSMMLVAQEILRSGSPQRDLWLYDTFAGLPQPNAELDVDVLGNRAIDGWQMHNLEGETSVWAFADEAEVRNNMASTGYPVDRLHFVVGKVEQTVPAHAPERIALLRIDTDWHASYTHLLESLYDRVVPGGVLLFDDYGHFLGARRAVDEFRQRRAIHLPLLRVDYSCRMMIKS